MPDPFKLYLDQMLRVEVADALRGAGHDVVRVSEVGQSRADDEQILEKAISKNTPAGLIFKLSYPRISSF